MQLLSRGRGHSHLRPKTGNGEELSLRNGADRGVRALGWVWRGLDPISTGRAPFPSAVRAFLPREAAEATAGTRPCRPGGPRSGSREGLRAEQARASAAWPRVFDECVVPRSQLADGESLHQVTASRGTGAGQPAAVGVEAEG